MNQQMPPPPEPTSKKSILEEGRAKTEGKKKLRILDPTRGESKRRGKKGYEREIEELSASKSRCSIERRNEHKIGDVRRVI